MNKGMPSDSSIPVPGPSERPEDGKDVWVKTSMATRKTVWEMFDAICWFKRVSMQAGLDELLTEFVEKNKKDYEAALELGWKDKKKKRGRQ